MAGLATLGAAGCAVWAGKDHDGPGAPSFVQPTHGFDRALVLSSGGPRGFVHVGVLKGLEQLKWRPQLVVGASVGALVGALYAAGLSVADIERLALDLGPTDFLRFNPMGREKLNGSAIADFVNERVGARAIEVLPMAFAACAITQSGREVVAFNRGDAGLAVQAATAIEGRFSPVTIRGTAHVDSDWVLPLPVRMAQALGAVNVLAVDASAHENLAPESAKAYRASDLKKRALIAPDAAAAKLCLHPQFGYWAGFDRAYRERAIAAGLADTLAQAKAISAL